MNRRSAFTLFELILAVALSATLLALIGTAVNLYLVRMDSGRTRVEEAQLARSILSTIAADIRATTVYQTQDISTAKQLALASAANNANVVQQFGSNTPFNASALSASGSGGSTTGSGTGGSGGVSGGSSSESANPDSLPPGLNGIANELTIDVSRLPRLDELFPAVPQQSSSLATSSAAASAPRPSDLKSIHYFIRQGATIDPSAAAAAAITPDSQTGVGGLVRQTLDRALRESAEQTANSQLLESGQMLLAPEVTQIQFVYFDGTAATDQWNMQDQTTLPTAVEVRIWIAPDPIDAESSSVPLEPRMYSQTVDLPLAAAAQSAASSSNQQDSSDTTGTSGDEETSGSGFGTEDNQ
jgi:hypothetical protein